MKKICAAVIGAAFGAALVSTQASATTTNLGTLPAGSTGSVVPIMDTIPAGTTSFDDVWDFSVASAENIVATISSTVTGTAADATGTLELISSTGTTLASHAITSVDGFFGAGFGPISLTSGTYSLEYIGTLAAQPGPTTSAGAITVSSATVSAVPEISTWLMMVLGFAGVGVLGYRRSAKKSAPKTSFMAA